MVDGLIKSSKNEILNHCFQSASGSPCPPSSPPVGPLSLTTRPEDQQQPPTSTPSSVKQEDARVSSGSEDDETRHTGPIPPGFSLVPSPMFGHGIMYMSHYLPPRGPAGCPTSMLADERRKRNRTFIDPVTEVPRLEYWFKRSTHPSHAVRINRSYMYIVIALICLSFDGDINMLREISVNCNSASVDTIILVNEVFHCT